MKLFIVALLMLVLTPAAPAGNFTENHSSFDDWKVEAIGALADEKVPEAHRKVLDAKGLRVVDDKGKVFVEIWFNKSINASKDEIAGATFWQFGEGNFVGVINFPGPASDYRGQGIKAGYYTLRYGLILQDGNHLGVSPARDFFLACSLTEDKDPAAKLSFDDMIKLSKLASGTGHPSTWVLSTPESTDKLPKVVKDEHGHISVTTRVTVGSNELTISLTLVGRAES